MSGGRGRIHSIWSTHVGLSLGLASRLARVVPVSEGSSVVSRHSQSSDLQPPATGTKVTSPDHTDTGPTHPVIKLSLVSN